jgi:hypothetical protein
VDAELKSLVDGTDGFLSWSDAEKIRFFVWYLQLVKEQPRFKTGDIGKCYDDLHLAKPNISQYLTTMEQRKPPELLRSSGTYSLEGTFRAQYDTKFGRRDATVKIEKLLLELPGKVPDLAEREFLNEALICFRNKAFRAAIVMCWNLSYFHFCHWILKHHIAAFNAEYPVRFPGIHKKATTPTITRYEEFSTDLKESEVIAIAKAAGIITNDQFKILDGKLGRRNSAAHPSTVHFSYPQAEEFIYDLVTNIVLALTI